MKILLVNNSVVPVTLYGGTERVIWYLAKELVKLGHEVVFLVKAGSRCDFASVNIIDESKDLVDQIPEDVDVVHFNYTPDNLNKVKKPYIITIHGNSNDSNEFDLNTVFVSKNHANRYGSESFIYNGLDWDDYSKPDLSAKRDYFHFLGNASWRVKNVQGAIDIIKATKSEKLKVLGGVRFNFNMGIRLTFSPRVKFYGMVGGSTKDKLLNNSKGLIFPVKWSEPFGLAITESLYFGCPVYGTPYGSLPELVNEDVGFLSNKKSEIVDAINNNSFSTKACYEYALEVFNSKVMAISYIEKYETVLSGKTLNAKAPKLIQVQTQKYLDWE